MTIRTIFVEVVVVIVLLMVIIGKNNDIELNFTMAFKARIPIALDSVGMYAIQTMPWD